MEHSTPDSRGNTPSQPRKVVLDQSAPARGTVPLRKVLGSTAKPKRSMPALGRAGWALVGVVCVAGAVGVVEVLFPETGPATAESVWQTPGLTKRQASVTTTIATADIDFDQVAADAALRTAESANSVTGATTGFTGAAPSSVLGNVVSPGSSTSTPGGSADTTAARTSTPGTVAGVSRSTPTTTPSSSSTVTTRPSTTTPSSPTTNGSNSSSPSTTPSSSQSQSTSSSTSTTRDTTTRNTTTRESTTTSTSTTKPADSSGSSNNLDGGGSGSGGSGSNSGKGSSGGGSNSGKG